MQVQVLDFIPPIDGVDAEFSTIRLGHTLAKRLAPGDTVFLMDGRTKTVFGTARVMRVETGTLLQQCQDFGATNHRELANDADGAADRLLAYVRKLFGPHIACDNKRSCVIFLKRLE
jgi:hypothetical protein